LKLSTLRPHIALWGLRAAWALAVALWAIALVPWFKTPPPAPLVQTARSAVAAQTRGGATFEQVIEPAPPVQATAPASAASVPDTATSSAARALRDAGVCGLPDGASSEVPSAAQKASHLARQASLGLQQAFEALRARADTPAQAAAWWLRVLVAREAAAEAPATAASCVGADCSATGALWPPLSAAVDALAQLAAASNDAWVQQVALRACDGAASTLCTSLGTRRWSTQEPDNAAAWLELAARDAQAVDEALFRAAKASRFDAHRGRLVAHVLQALPEQAQPMQRYAAWQRSDEMERASDARALAAAARTCSEAARRDSNRDQLCDGAARWLTQNVRPPLAAEASVAAATRPLDCASVERQWREARDGALRGARVATSGLGSQRP